MVTLTTSQGRMCSNSHSTSQALQFHIPITLLPGIPLKTQNSASDEKSLLSPRVGVFAPSSEPSPPYHKRPGDPLFLNSLPHSRLLSSVCPLSRPSPPYPPRSLNLKKNRLIYQTERGKRELLPSPRPNLPSPMRLSRLSPEIIVTYRPGLLPKTYSILSQT